MLTETGVDDVAMNLHILKGLFIIVVDLVNDLVDVVGGLLLAQVEKVAQ